MNHRLSTIILILSLGIGGCAERAPEMPEPPEVNLFEVTARGLQLSGPTEIPSGWVTFRFKNDSEMTHFAVIERMPEGYGVAEQQEQVAPVFQKGMDLLNAGQVDSALAAFGALPEWFGEIVFVGGPGLTSPGRVSESTVFLEPGSYLMECYVKTDGIFHSYNPAPDVYGMIHGFTVSADSSTAQEPVATLSVSISSEQGFSVDGEPTAGDHVVAVRYEDQTVHENFLGHDVHLARLSDETDLDELSTWMDWSQPTGLETPTPVEWLGGNHEMPGGSIGYFKATLDPGRYAWVAEVTNPAKKRMLIVFDVE
jgi:hypothetical protein